MSVKGSKTRPRLSVFRSAKAIYGQIIDDLAGKTLVAADSLKLKEGDKSKQAFLVGQHLAQKARQKKIKRVVFDRGRYLYHGRVKALADGARKGGLSF